MAILYILWSIGFRGIESLLYDHLEFSSYDKLSDYIWYMILINWGYLYSTIGYIKWLFDRRVSFDEGKKSCHYLSVNTNNGQTLICYASTRYSFLYKHVVYCTQLKCFRFRFIVWLFSNFTKMMPWESTSNTTNYSLAVSNRIISNKKKIE